MVSYILFTLAIIGSTAGGTQDQPSDDMFPSWSPDGTRIVFQSNRTGDDELYLVNADGTDLQRLTWIPGRDAHPNISPDGRRIVFQSPRNGAGPREVDIYVMGLDGKNVHRLTQNGTFSGVPAWSPDGTQIAFQMRVIPGEKSWDEGHWQIVLMDSAGRHQRILTHDAADSQVPNWSPDGSRIVFWSNKRGNNDLYVMDLLTMKVVQLTDSKADDIAAAWSPDGSEIGFLSDRGGTYDVYVMNSDGGLIRRVSHQTGSQGVPFWNADGKRILLNIKENGSMRIGILTIQSENVELLGKK